MQNSENTKNVVNPVQQFLKNELATITWPREGSMVVGSFIKKAPRSALFDLGRFGTGIVFGLEYLNARDQLRELKFGDEINAKVVSLDGENGCIELSLVDAGKQKMWQQVQDAQESGEVVTVKVTGVNASGVVVNVFDLRGFIPTSQLSAEHAPKEVSADPQKIMDELKGLVGQELNVKIINFNPKKNKLIASERETVSVNVKEMLKNYTPGQIIEGVVSGIADFGVFVKFIDNPQIEGLVHISEIDHKLVDNPKEAVTMNETVKVKILEIKEGKVFLSLKALKKDPWESIASTLKTGATVQGAVYKFNPFGAVINIEGAPVQGLIHVSEFGSMEDMKKTLSAETSHSFTIEAVKPEEKRIVLKFKK